MALLPSLLTLILSSQEERRLPLASLAGRENHLPPLLSEERVGVRRSSKMAGPKCTHL
jgi:hypothetical protein